MGVTKKNNHFNKLKVNMQRMSNQVKNMRIVLLMLFAALSLSVSAQTITLTGNVKDATGEPIIGASVVEKVIPLTVQLLTLMVTSLLKFPLKRLLLFRTSV